MTIKISSQLSMSEMQKLAINFKQQLDSNYKTIKYCDKLLNENLQIPSLEYELTHGYNRIIAEYVSDIIDGAIVLTQQSYNDVMFNW